MGTLVFILLWVVVGVTLLVIALSGGPKETREHVLQTQTKRGRRNVTLVFLVIYLGVGIAIPTLVIADNEERNTAGPTGVRLTAAEERGRALFGTNCQQCHTLAAANTAGRTGPDLDEMRPKKELVLDAILNGRKRGIGTMPAELLQGEEAEDVAAFVAKVAGRSQ